jgi:hypothetical protein
MHLLGVRIVQVGPFEDVSLPFCDEDGQPRPVTVIHGGGGVGKTTLLLAIAATRPGHAVLPPTSTRDVPMDWPAGNENSPAPPHVICDWGLGRDDPERAHALRLASPNVRVFSNEEQEAARRREQLVIDRVAREAGFAFVAIPSSRWFSRQPITLTSPSRTILRHDVRAGTSLDETARSDLARETKQALAYAELSSCLVRGRGRLSRFEVLGDAMRSVVDELSSLAQFSYRGIDPGSFEPVFTDGAGRAVTFDGLPTRVRHLVAFGALPVRALWAAYPGQDPRSSEGVVAIDEVCLNQDPGLQAKLVGALRSVLPRVQWVLTTTSPAIAGSCDTREVLALRRLPETLRVELFVGFEARTH